MTRPLKVYGWTDMRRGEQTREVMAARSKTEVCEVLGRSARWSGDWLSETRNPAELAVALADPGEIFARSLDNHGAPYVRIDSWTPSAPGKEKTR